MNLFYVLGATNYVIDSSLNVSLSPISSSKRDGISEENELLVFISQGFDGVSFDTGTVNPLIINIDSTNYFQLYSGYVKSPFGLAFIGSKSYSTGEYCFSCISYDGLTYTEYSVLNTVVWKDISYGNGIFCIVGISGTNEITIGISIDGSSWSYTTKIVTGVTKVYIRFGFNKFVIACDGLVSKSSDGITWIDVGIIDIPKSMNVNSNGFIILTNVSLFNSSVGDIWETIALPSIIGTDVSLAVWKKLVSNDVTICLYTTASITDTFSNMISVIFSTDNGYTWGTQTLINEATREIFPLFIPKFWEHFVQSTES